jgi:site-specific DNA-adenine methylase
MPVNKRDFNDVVRQNTIKFIDRLATLNIGFTTGDFRDFSVDGLTAKDFLYCDPPYLVTCASYNEQSGWTEAHERALLELLDDVNAKGIRFALSNVLENKGKSNDILRAWSQKYNIHHLNHTYGNCSYHAKDKSLGSTDEVLITNY